MVCGGVDKKHTCLNCEGEKKLGRLRKGKKPQSMPSAGRKMWPLTSAPPLTISKSLSSLTSLSSLPFEARGPPFAHYMCFGPEESGRKRNSSHSLDTLMIHDARNPAGRMGCNPATTLAFQACGDAPCRSRPSL